MEIFHLEYPYTENWSKGYLVVNSENRRTVILYNSPKDRSSTQYARYLLSVSLGRYLENDEHVDHIDNDCTNDDIKNLQILTKSANNKKAARVKGKSLSEIECPSCYKVFTRRKGNTQAVHSKKNTITCCSIECSDNFKKLSLSDEERAIISERSLLRVFKQYA